MKFHFSNQFFLNKSVCLFGVFLAIGSSQIHARSTIPIYDESRVNQVCQATLDQARNAVDKITRIPLTKVSVRNTLLAWNALQINYEDAEGPLELFANVHTDPKVRELADKCLLKFNELRTELFQSEALYQRFKLVKAVKAAEQKLKKDMLERFEDTGITLSVDKRERVKKIFNQLEELRQEFDRNVRDNKTKVAFTAEEMQGVPAAFLAKAKRDETGNYLLGFDYPEYLPFMANADSEAARQRYFIAYTNRGTFRNIEIANQISALRLELANLYGLPSYAHFVTRRNMVENPATVHQFLESVKAAVRESEIKEIKELKALKAKLSGKTVEQVSFNRWDTAYYQEKFRRAQFDIDQEAIRKYFPAAATIDWVLYVSGQLYGVTFKEVKVPVWHSEVRYFDVLDAKTGKFISGIYLDLFPREGKYKHAAAFGIRGVSKLVHRTPVSVLVTNFNREGFDHNEVETLFHEFGHVLHGVLSTTDFNPHAGTSVDRDFVEAPSQMFEEWARKPESLTLIQKVCGNCPIMDVELIKRLDAARKYGAGVKYARQHLYASYDMAMTSDKPGDSMSTWRKMEGETPLGYVENTLFPSSFSHQVNHYGAGYYGYMWSEVVALDMLSAFGGNIMNPQVGRRFRQTILANGGQFEAKDLVFRFLGRKVDNKAFFAEITGQR